MPSKKTIIRDLHDLQIRMKNLEEAIDEHYKEWTLSDRILSTNKMIRIESFPDLMVLDTNDVKEFIRQLKIKLRDTVYADQPLSETFRVIDNLLGEKLNDVCGDKSSKEGK